MDMQIDDHVLSNKGTGRNVPRHRVLLCGLRNRIGAGILYSPVNKVYGESMKKATLVLLLALAVLYCAGNAHAAYSGETGSTTGWGDDPVNRALAEEFAKCSAFSGIAAECVNKSTQERREESATKYGDVAKRFYRGSYMLVGQDFTQESVRVHDTAMRRSAGNACEGFPKLEQQYRKRCDDTFKRLPRKLQ